jgi:hypothetical protein
MTGGGTALHDRGDFPLGGELTADIRGKHSAIRQLSTQNRDKCGQMS